VPAGCFGEIGLTGELRYVAHAERRLEEAARFGLQRVLAPRRCLEDRLEDPLPDQVSTGPSVAGAIPASTVREALAAAFDEPLHVKRAA
jgi:predicted ATP-dependent serine protease